MMNEEILIQYVLYDVGSEVLRDVMLQLLQPDTLEEALQSSKSKICELCEMQLLSRQDYDLLKEVPPHPEKFDIHLLTKILIHICPGVTVPQKEWFRIPDRTDSSLGSDIMRLEYMAFLPEFQPGDLAKVEAFLVRISKHGSQAIQNIQEKIEARKTDKLKAIQAEKDFVDLLKETPDIDIYSQWDDVIPKIESEPRYKALDDDSFRKRLFFECKMDEIQEEFMQLLNTVPGIYKYTEWSDVEQRIKDDPRYMMIQEVMAYQDTKGFDSLLRNKMWFIDYKKNIEIHRASITEMNEIKKEVDTQYLGCKSWPAYLATDSDGAKLQTEKKHVIVVELPAEINNKPH